MVAMSLDESHARQVGNVLRRVERAFLIGVEGATEVWLVRHGDAYDDEWWDDDDPPLSRRGRDQARRLAERVNRIPYQGLYASPLRRALDTARAIAPEVRVDERLVEMETSLVDGHLEFVEPAPRARERMRAAVADAVAEHRGGRVVMVGHGAAIMSYLGPLLGADPDGGPFGGVRLFPYYTSVSVVRVLGDLQVVGSVVDVAHLER
jgi:broad specificity phosphatase PhoE